jgi:WD40 repeat protein
MSGDQIAPYKGLRPFDDTAEDVRFFFGRDREREIIVANLMAARLTVLYGETGVGKSSVLRAGVAHELRQQALRRRDEQGVPTHAVCVFDAWRDDPVEDLADAVSRAVGETLRVEVDPSMSRGSLADRLDAWTRVLEGDLYLLLDQTEEFFLYHEAEGSQSPFVGEIADVVQRPGLRVSVLISLREDAVAKLDRFKGQIPNVLGNYLRLEHLDRAAGRGAIVGPIERYNSLAEERVEIEGDLIEAVLYEVATGRFELGQVGRGAVEGTGANGHVETPFLQLVMQRLWEEERQAGSHLLRLSTLRDLGGAEQIVHDHLNEAMRALTAADKDVAASVFGYLVTPSGTKIAHDPADLARYAGVEEREVQPVLSQLTDARILRPVAGEGNSPRYEIYHDVLGAAVLAWRGDHEAKRELGRVRGEARRRHRRLLGVIGAGAVLLALMAGVTVYALTQRNEAQTQAARAEAAQDAALHAANVAQEQEAEADKQRAEANAQKANAEAAEKQAREDAATATAAQQQAQTNAELAEQNAAQAQAAEEASALSAAQARDAEQEAKDAEQEAKDAAQEAKDAEQEARDAAEDAQTQKVIARQSEARAKSAESEAKARARAQRALTLLTIRPLESLRLSLGAARRAPETRLAESVLRTSLASSRVRAVLPGGGGPVTGASYSPDGRFVLTVAGRARLFDGRTGEPVRTLGDDTTTTTGTFSPDGRLVLTGTSAGTARLWPVASGSSSLLGGAPQLLRGHTKAVASTAFSSSGRFVVTASNDQTARVWHTDNGEQMSVLQHDGPVQGALFSPDEKLVLTVSRVARTGRLLARLFEATSGDLLLTFDQIGIRSAIFSPDGSLVVTTSNDNTARVWSLSGEEVAVLPQDENVVSAAFSPGGLRLVTSTEGAAAFVWRVGTWARELFLVGPINVMTGASFSPDGRFIVVSNLDRTARIFRSGNGLEVAAFAGHEDGVLAASFSPDSRSLVTASLDGSARIWDPGTEDLLQVVGKTNGKAIQRASFSPDGRLAVSASADGTARILLPARGRQLQVLSHGEGVNDAQFNPQGTLVVTASDDDTARIWQLDGALRRVLRHDGDVLRAIFSPDGKLIATASADRMVRIWRGSDGRLLQTLRGHTDTVLDVAFSPDGELVASAGDRGDMTARIWQIDGEEVQVLRHRGPVVRVSFSPDGRLVVTASGDEMARLWRVGTGKRVHLLRGHAEFVRDAQFSDDGKLVVTASDDRDARIWSVATGNKVTILRGHLGGPLTASFSRDGRWVVTAGRTAVGLWDTSTGRFFQPTGLGDPFLRGHTAGPLSTAILAPDGMRILSASGDGTVRTYLCDLCGGLPALIRLAEARLTALKKELTLAERRAYLRG